MKPNNPFGLNFKAIIFDMDGVITNTMPYHFDAWQRVFSLVGIRVNCYDVYTREGQDGLSTVKEIFRRCRRPLAPGAARRILRLKEELFKRTVRRRFVTGSRPFLRRAQAHGVRVALVTGTSRHEMERILPRTVRAFFEVIVTGSDVKKGKPHPEPFLRALRGLRMQAEHAVVIENAPFGIQAAKRAGLFCIAIETSLPRRFLKDADVVFRSFKELEASSGFAP